MKKPKLQPGSLRSGMTLVTLVCWILPILIVTTVAGILLNANYNTSVKQSVDDGTENAMHQVQMRMQTIIEDAKAVSYDGVVRQAYRDYSMDGIKFPVYRTATDYLTQKFTRSDCYSAAFISFYDPGLDIHAYASAPGASRLALLRHYTSEVLPAAKELVSDKDTGIYFLQWGDNELYLVRNLLDNHFVPYAILIVSLEKSVVFQSLYSIPQILSPEISIDGVVVSLSDGSADPDGSGRSADVRCTASIDDHQLVFSGKVMLLSIWRTVPMLRWSIVFIMLLVIPLLILIVWLFHRNLNHPMEVLIEANSRVQSGERGFQIDELPPNREFTQLYSHFNAMSADLEDQFNRLYLEQQALQQAKIKALQSQINPHFLNNTLEIINWEARLSDNERVCSMIEALSTMLDAAIGRDGRSQVTVAEELKYVDAYLYITKERLGDRICIRKEIDDDTLGCYIPLLMLQPIIENAVEHDLSRTGGGLCLQCSRSGSQLRFRVLHDGSITSAGWENIRRALEDVNVDPVTLRSGSIGIRNVNQRLKLLYGSRSSFAIREDTPGHICAEITLPVYTVPTGS